MPAKPSTILVADNDRAVNALLTELLRQRGLQVESVHDGGSALSRLRGASAARAQQQGRQQHQPG